MATRTDSPRLLIFDLDGTALGGHEPYAQFPPDFARFLDELDARGIRWATCTTWGIEGQWQLIQDSALTSRPAAMCGASGRLLATVRNGAPEAVEAHEALIHQLDEEHQAATWPKVRPILEQLLHDDLVVRFAYDYFHPQAIIDYTARPESADAAWQHVQPLLDSGDYYSFSGGGSTRVTLLPRHMNKGLGVQAIQRLTGVPPEQTILAGDAANDLPMFDQALARWFIAPANAEPRIRERLASLGGYLAQREFSWGVIEGVQRILDA